MDQINFIQDMAVVMAVSAVILLICRPFKLPVVLGYILAGVLIGPNAPPYALVKDIHSIHILSELGVIFLLFSIGLEFSLSRLMKVGLVAFLAATVEILLMIGIGFWLGRCFGWKLMDSLFLGAILSISSTTIIAKVLIDTKKIKEQFAQVILGILIIEDLLAIVIIAVLSGVASTGSVEIGQVGTVLVRVLIFVTVMIVGGALLIPRLIRYVNRFESDEMIIVTVLGLCLAGSLAAARFGFSVALGAFLVGAVIAEMRESKHIVHKFEPIRDMFTAIFFVSVGMLISPQTVSLYWVPILILTAATVFGKIISCSVATFLTGYPAETSLKVGLGLAQIGEFSFIIARLGQSTGVTSDFLYPIAVSVSAVTTLTTPVLMRHTGPVTGAILWLTPKPLRTVLSLYTGWFSNLTRSSHVKDVNRVFRSFLWFVAAVVLGSFVYAAGSPFLPRWFLLSAAGIFVLSAGVYLWRSIDEVHSRIEKMVTGIFEGSDNEPPGAHKELVRLIGQEYPWAVKTEDFLLPYQETGANQPVRDLRLRSETGASIVSIYRNDETIANPSPDTRLLPGDALLLMGDEEQLASAIRYLQKKTKEPPVSAHDPSALAKTVSFDVKPDFPFLGKTIRELKLRRKTGATILGIQKEGLLINNPDPEVVLEEGDKLGLFGLPAQLESALRYLSAADTRHPA